MLVTDANGLPVGAELASASRHEVKLAVPALQTVRVPRARGSRPRQRPEELVADKAFLSVCAVALHRTERLRAGCLSKAASLTSRPQTPLGRSPFQIRGSVEPLQAPRH
jgi:hypothetical protein